MFGSRAVALALSLLVVAATAPGGAAPGDPTSFDLGQQFDRVQFQVVAMSDGSARWTFHYERTLDNASERDQFEAFAADFRATETTLYNDFVNQSRTLVREAEGRTGRTMAAEDFARDARVVTRLNDIGVVEMSFTWVGFARTEGDRVVVGDVFEGGLYVGPDQSLVFVAGEGLEFREVQPSGSLSGGSLETSDSVTWSGERSFTDNRPRAVLAPPSSSTGGSTGGADDAPDNGGSGDASGVGLAIVGLVVIAAVGIFLYRRRDGVPGGLTTLGGGGAASSSVDDAALLDDEERVDGLLREHGGRMRQSAIVDATGWSKSKVSMVLTEMEEAGEVRKLRVGRENIISLPGHEPEAARSSLEDSD